MKASDPTTPMHPTHDEEGKIRHTRTGILKRNLFQQQYHLDLVERLSPGLKDSGEMTREELAVCANLFTKFDEDKNEEIDVKELQGIVRHLGICIDSCKLKELMDQVDGGKGHIDFTQFVHLMQLWKESQMVKMLIESPEELKMNDVHSRIDKTLKQSVNGLLSTDSHPRSALYVALIFIAMYYWVVVLHEDATGLHDAGHASQVVVESIFSLVLTIDMLLSFATADTSGDSPVTGLKEITLKYLKTTFTIDFLSSLPFDIIAFYLSGGPIAPYRVLRHFRLLRVVRVPFYFKPSGRVRLDSTYISFHYGVKPCLFIVFWLVVFIHGITEVFVLLKKETCGVTLTYPTAVYWVLYTVTSVGYGDVPIETDSEKIFASFVFIIGVVGNGVVLAKIITMQRNSDVDAERNEKMRSVLAVLKRYEVPTLLQQEILAFQSHLLGHNKSWEAITSLPDTLHDSLELHIKVKLVSKVSIFRDHPECHVGVSRCLKSLTAKPDEYLVSYGEVGDSMFIILHGYADVVNGEGAYTTTLGKGKFFGECSLLHGVPRIASVVAITYMDLLRLEKKDFGQLLPRYPRLKKSMDQQSKSYFVMRDEGVTVLNPLSPVSQLATPASLDRQFSESVRRGSSVSFGSYPVISPRKRVSVASAAVGATHRRQSCHDLEHTAAALRTALATIEEAIERGRVVPELP